MNKLNKEVFGKGMQKLSDTFPFWKLDIENPRVMATWYEYFHIWDDETFSNAVERYIQNETMPPTVKGLRNMGGQPSYFKKLEYHYED